MADSYYKPGEQRATRVGDLFATIAPRYDLINDLQSFGLHRVWKRRLVRLANPQSGERALDVCCGTGDLAFALSARGAAVTGLDFSEAMLDVAKKRMAKDAVVHSASPKTRPHFIQGDAQQLPFDAGQFDIVTVGYGLRNLASWETGVQEMWRVTRTGGRLLMLDFGKPPNLWWRAIYFGYLRRFVPLLGRLVCGNASAYRYILESLEPYPAQDGVDQALRQLGGQEVRIIYLLGGVMTINYARKG